ncbi:MAG: hypothetical protein U1D55_00710 [Phycisphaerae bacterium]
MRHFALAIAMLVASPDQMRADIIYASSADSAGAARVTQTTAQDQIRFQIVGDNGDFFRGLPKFVDTGIAAAGDESLDLISTGGAGVPSVPTVGRDARITHDAPIQTNRTSGPAGQTAAKKPGGGTFPEMHTLILAAAGALTFPLQRLMAGRRRRAVK